MYSNNKEIRDVADVAARIMAGLPPLQEKLHPNQQKIDVHEPEKDQGKHVRPNLPEEVEQQDEAMSHQAATTMKHIPNPSPAQKQAAKDIKPGVGGYRDRIDMLKSAGVKEEVEELDELSTSTLKSYIGGAQKDRAAQSDSKNSGDREQAAYAKKQSVKRTLGIVDAKSRLSKEEVEELDEVKMADLPSTKVQGRSYGSSKPQPSAFDVLKGPKEKELKSIESEKKKKKMSEMVALYKDGGMKAFFESIKKDDLISEEPDSEQFAKELEDQKKRAAGTKPQANVAKASVQSVKQEKVEITDEMIFEVLENAGIDFESLSDDELQEVVNEAYEILDEISTKTLAKAASAASDPDADYHYGKSHDPQKFADHAKKTKDAKSAAAVQGAADAKGHYTRPGHTLGSYDKLAHRTPARVTGAGKANKQDVNKLKKSISLNAEATEQDIYVIDADLANGVDQVNIEERMMTKPEKEKKEQMVKSMKKGLAGFKERYGDRAKSVMYATATKNAMKEEKEDHHQKGYDHVREPISDEPYLDNARERFNELKKQNPHKKGSQEHKDWHSGASAAYEEHKDILKGN